MRVVPPDPQPTAAFRTAAKEPPAVAEAEESVQLCLRGVAARIGPGRVTLNLDVRIGEPAEAIIASASEHGAGLIVMATHGRSGLSRLVMGSVAGAVVRNGSVPVLLLRPPALAGAAVEIPTAQDERVARLRMHLTPT